MPKDTLVLALGNPLRGDDGVASVVLERLAELPLSETVDFENGGTPGLETALLLQGYRRVIVVDAANMDLEPGQWRRFIPDAVELQAGDIQGSLHSAGLAEALSLGAGLEILPPELTIYGIQPTVLGWQPGLSPAVEAAVPHVTAAIQEELLIHSRTMTHE